MLSFSSELLRTPWSHLGDLRCEGFSKVYALHVQVWFLRDASLPFTTYSMRFFDVFCMAQVASSIEALCMNDNFSSEVQCAFPRLKHS